MHQALELLRLRPDGFRVFSGDDWMALPLCACGGDGLISVASNELPRELTELVRLARTGDLAAARALLWKLHAAARCQLHRVQSHPGEGGARGDGPHPQRAPAAARSGTARDRRRACARNWHD